jgi:hypothetical protein
MTFCGSHLSVLLCAFLVAATSRLHAQTIVYANADITQYGFSSSASGNGSYQPGTNNYSYYKVGGGLSGGAIQYFPSSSRLKAGVDLRGVYSPGKRGGAGGFAALRIAFIPHRNVFSPYFEIGGGVLSTTVYNVTSVTSGSSNVSITEQSERIHSGAADFDLGLNIRVAPRFAIRALEISGYAGSNVALSTVGFGVAYQLGAVRK